MQTEEEFLRCAERALEAGEPIQTPHGTYVRWDSGHGAELWVQIDPDNEVVGLAPHFSGDAVMRIGLTERIAHTEGSPLGGAFHGWSDPSTDDPETGAYPFVFETPDYMVHQAVELPTVLDVQLAGFAHELTAYASEEAYDASQHGELKFATESFIPSGLFTPDGEATDPPEAHAIFTGRVLRTSLLTNPVTGANFYWAKVRTLGGEVDVVADPEIVNEPIAEGGVVTGSFWLSGRLLNYPRRASHGC